MGGRLPKHSEELWSVVAGLDHHEQMSLLAHCVGMTVLAVRQRWERKAGAQSNADRIAEALSLDMTAHWEPTADAYFSRVTKAQILEAVREAASDEEASRMADMKKQALAEAAEKLLSRTNWLPSLLQSSHGEPMKGVNSAAA